ncbi:MAG: transporter substrate-binding domain-containing protein [Clostridia bacterium]|nr:transporter substrate-binding domain-containing protein [Clostridia bacterium]
MKKLLTIALLLALVSALALSACAEGGDALARIRERGTLVIATEGNWQPWTYHDENDVLTGFDVEIGTLLAEGLGVEPDFQETTWDAILAGVDAGRFDIACNGVGYTKTRAEKYSFSTPYVYTEIALVVKGDNDAINTAEDLNGRTTANTASSTYAAIGEQYGATVTPVDDLIQTIMLVEQGRVDATINAKASIDDYLSEHPEANIRIAQILPQGEPVAYPVRKGEDTDTLIAAINEILEAKRQDGTLAALSEKYFGADLTREG